MNIGADPFIQRAIDPAYSEDPPAITRPGRPDRLWRCSTYVSAWRRIGSSSMVGACQAIRCPRTGDDAGRTVFESRPELHAPEAISTPSPRYSPREVRTPAPAPRISSTGSYSRMTTPERTQAVRRALVISRGLTRASAG